MASLEKLLDYLRQLSLLNYLRPMQQLFGKYGQVLLWLITAAFLWRLGKVDPLYAFLLATALVGYYIYRWLKKRKS